MHAQVSAVLRAKLMNYNQQLQQRWGDPRVYEAQQEQMMRQEAALQHDLSRRGDTSAYAQQAAANRATHDERIKRRYSLSSGRTPRSQSAAPRKKKPPAQPSSEP